MLRWLIFGSMLLAAGGAAQEPFEPRHSCVIHGSCAGGICHCDQGYRCHVDRGRFCECIGDPSQSLAEDVCAGQSVPGATASAPESRWSEATIACASGGSCELLRTVSDADRAAAASDVDGAARRACVAGRGARCLALAEALTAGRWSPALASSVRTAACEHVHAPACVGHEDPAVAIVATAALAFLGAWGSAFGGTLGWFLSTTGCMWDGPRPHDCVHTGPSDDALAASAIPLVGPWIMLNTPGIDASVPIVMGIVEDISFPLALLIAILAARGSTAPSATLRWQHLAGGGRLSVLGTF